MLVKVYATSMVVDAGTLIPNTTYLVGSSIISFFVPTYSFIPTNSVINVSVTLVNPPSFVQVSQVNGSWTIYVQTSNTSDTGQYLI
jgi:hypothetical protein